MNVAAARSRARRVRRVRAAPTSRASSPARSGPTPRTASISPDVNDPAARNVSFDELKDAYREQAAGLLEGGCDLFLVETIFDTLNAKAAIFALDELMEDSGERLPVIISGTVTDASGRILSGQTVSAFWHSRAPCASARGRPQLRPRRGADAALHRGAGEGRRRHLHQLLPERRPAEPDERDRLRRNARGHRRLLEEFAKAGFLNIAGGCCGTTPEHIAQIAQRVGAYRPRCRSDAMFSSLMAA